MPLVPQVDLSAALGTVRFEQPWVLILAALALVPLFLGPRGVGRLLRTGAMLLLVVALAQPSSVSPGGHLALLVDVSDSVGAGGLQAALALELRELARAPELLLVAGEVTRTDSLPAVAPAFLPTTSTDLPRALQVAVAGGASRILLISDGVAPVASVLSALPDVPVDVLYVPSVVGVALAELLLPGQAAPGQVVEAVAVITADLPARVTVRPAAGGQALEPIELEVGSGRTAVPFSFRAGSASSLMVSVTLEADAPIAGLDRASAELSVRTRPPVLVLGDPAMAAVLAAQGIEAVSGVPADLRSPVGYSAVVIRGSSAEFTPGQLDLLRAYVENGGGLLMTGGPESFGFGAWYRTAVEEILPVTTDLRTEVTLPLVALVMVVDRSQSMATGSPSKIELAKEGAIQVVELAYQDDLLGLIAFSDVSATDWVFNLRPATERGKREMLSGILSLGTSGGTVLAPAYQRAIAALEATEAAVKHIIVLSDGRLYDGLGPFAAGAAPDFGTLAASALAGGITTSTIAIGDAADFERLRTIAEAGGGRYYEALDAATLPRIFTNEALTATRALLVDVPTVPLPRPNPLLSFPESLPPVAAYVATSLKGDAQELLGGRPGEPLLATRRAGLGRTAALMTDLNAWVGELGAWPGLSGALATLTRWLQAAPSSYDATVQRDGTELRLVVDAVRGGEYVNNERLEARFGGATVLLDQVAPGRYVGQLPWREGAGSEVVFSVGGEVVARAQAAGPDPEFAQVDGAALLSSIAQRTGGEVVSSTLYAPPMSGRRAPLWPLAAGAALALFLVELGHRRLSRPAQRAYA